MYSIYKWNQNIKKVFPTSHLLLITDKECKLKLNTLKVDILNPFNIITKKILLLFLLQTTGDKVTISNVLYRYMWRLVTVWDFSFKSHSMETECVTFVIFAIGCISIEVPTEFYYYYHAFMFSLMGFGEVAVLANSALHVFIKEDYILFGALLILKKYAHTIISHQ